MSGVDRVRERRRAAAVARHYRDEEDLSIAEIARRLGRAEATVKAYLYDPSDANKGPSWERGGQGQEGASSGVTCPPRRQQEKSVPDGPLFLRLRRLSSTSDRLES
jgi:cyanate lyase